MLELIEKVSSRRAIYKCPVCNKEKELGIYHVSVNKPKKCRSCTVTERNMKHGKSKSRLYRIWQGMKSRCMISSASGYKNYGGRGIFVCKSWSDSFEEFYSFAINNGYDDNLEIERINNNDGYHPSNCIFVRTSVNAKNKRLYKNNNTGFRGVVSVRKKFTSSIRENGKNIHLGTYPTAEEAYINRLIYIYNNNIYRREELLMIKLLIRSGIFDVKENLIITSKGQIVKFTTLLTGKGQQYFLMKLGGLE